ncbi:hypothetical protein DY000_02009525 [Brassica cretica]|uniref:Uncharacterized protein n=1 Tax=Brassica cretica TaxID=69181 RepID=A0ABQ7CDH3_BRACR|nr:hypothetical protein DY000_02009525 [Brassica cretica]
MTVTSSYKVLCKYKEEGLVLARLCTARDVAVEQARVEKVATMEIYGFFGGRRLVIRR